MQFSETFHSKFVNSLHHAPLKPFFQVSNGASNSTHFNRRNTKPCYHYSKKHQVSKLKKFKTKRLLVAVLQIFKAANREKTIGGSVYLLPLFCMQKNSDNFTQIVTKRTYVFPTFREFFSSCSSPKKNLRVEN